MYVLSYLSTPLPIFLFLPFVLSSLASLSLSLQLKRTSLVLSFIHQNHFRFGIGDSGPGRGNWHCWSMTSQYSCTTTHLLSVEEPSRIYQRHRECPYCLWPFSRWRRRWKENIASKGKLYASLSGRLTTDPSSASLHRDDPYHKSRQKPWNTLLYKLGSPSIRSSQIKQLIRYIGGIIVYAFNEQKLVPWSLYLYCYYLTIVVKLHSYWLCAHCCNGGFRCCIHNRSVSLHVVAKNERQVKHLSRKKQTVIRLIVIKTHFLLVRPLVKKMRDSCQQ